MTPVKEREAPIVVVRKRGRHHGHHGGAWKVAFADFMTAMFALFLVLWIVNQSSDVKAAIAGYFQDPLGRADEFGNSFIPGDGAQTQAVRPLTQSELLDPRRDRLQRLGQRIRDRLAQLPEFRELAGYVEVELTEEGLRITLLEDSVGVFFESGSPVPRPAGARLLALLGGELAQVPNPIVIDGHTDARPYAASRPYSNWELSTDRANVARRILQAGGYPERQVRQVLGSADRFPRVKDDPFAPENRRVTITVLWDEVPPPTEVAAPGPAAAPAPRALATSAREAAP
ncbi:MAG TPA: flagellar motor protein MotB [Gemmatimonadales bacterium]|nr:flagellar motor protein MotB [Gemmatimonadales bacterium]